MGVTVRINGGDLANVQFSSRDLMREIGLLARERILRRTAEGRDQNDQSFTPYSLRYQLQKAKELGPGPVNLSVSGGMLNAIVITDVTDNSVTLGFSS